MLCSLSALAQPAATSKWCYPGPDGKLVYGTTKQGDRMIDFSHAGYMGGGVALPYVPAKITVHPLGEGVDCSEFIQQAIDRVSELPKDADGFRGAVLLAPGRYECSQPLRIATDGVVLRGSGSDKSGSVIVMNGPKHTAIMVSNGVRRGADAGESGVKVIDKYVPAGSYSVTVSDASAFKAGDVARISKPVTEKWVKYMKMHDMSRNGKPQTWLKAGSRLSVEREIASVDGNKITFVVPLVDSYDVNLPMTTLRCLK